ncbi:hypothetical protein R9X49_20955 [Pectobacterium carotovorum]|uniref:hypothetical protein n=1 Tax=Pectobacterium carotovorum TaxID=554 RepID=UPI0029D89005|nr:hypothetical protein [Pectobacterium carotovorum]MDX6917583.1 hypothetical protein [Pectobacterium carotovorum]
MHMSFVYINAQRVISNFLLLLTLVVLSPHSIADDKKLDAIDIHQQTVSVSTQSNVDAFNHFDDEKNLAKLAEKISSSKEKRDALEILEKVDSFYSKSFNSLLALIISIIGIAGIFIPLGISYYQAKLLRKQTIDLQERISNEVSEKLSDLKKSLYADNEKRMLSLDGDLKKNIERIEKEYKIEIKSLRSESLARINHLSAATCLLNEVYGTSSSYYFDAALNYMDYSDHGNLRRVIFSLKDNDIFAKIPPQNKTPELDKKYNDFINRLSSFNVDSIYNDDVIWLKKTWREFEKRVEKNDD